MPAFDARCICGHAFEAHEHLRAGTECSLCPPGRCPRFRRALRPRRRAEGLEERAGQ